VIPYAHSPSVRKLSKIATLLLAKNYILMQTNALEEMRKLVTYLSHSAGIPVPPCLPGGPPPPPSSLGLPPPPSPPFSLALPPAGSGGGEATRLPSSLFPRLSMPPGLHFPVITTSASSSLLSHSHLSAHHHSHDPPTSSAAHLEAKRHGLL
jgi:hypothetical protein